MDTGRGGDAQTGKMKEGRWAGWTGLEPAASGVTGRRYNQLNYHPKNWALFIKL